jgi:hypothetical protein
MTPWEKRQLADTIARSAMARAKRNGIGSLLDIGAWVERQAKKNCIPTRMMSAAFKRARKAKR